MSRLVPVVLALLLSGSPLRAETDRMVPIQIDGVAVRLAMQVHTPAGAGPFPTLIFHHGSTGRGNDPSLFARRFEPAPLIEWFRARGWAVVLPSRRGRGGSEGEYDEGFGLPRSAGYSCDPSFSLPGAERALRDIDAATAAILAMPFVDRTRVAVGGQSRGGILSIAWSGRRPSVVRAAVNFVGGWMGEGCPTAAQINRSLFDRGGAFGSDTLWLYGDRDAFYSLRHSRANHASFLAAGGRGAFHEFQPGEGRSGHGIVFAPVLWSEALAVYLRAQGLPAP